MDKQVGWSISLGDAARTAIFYLCAVMLVLSTNTLYGRIEGHSIVLRLGIVVCVAILIVMYWIRGSIAKRALQTWMAWCALIVVVYASVSIANSDDGSRALVLFFAITGLFPLLLHFMEDRHELQRFLRAFVNVMCVLASASLALWVAGPIMNVIQPNCVIENTWNGLGTLTYSRGYYDLLYVVQRRTVGTLVIIRNTGIFVEAPMYSFALCCALLLECFLCGRPRKAVIAIIATTVITTFSSTGWILLIGIALLKLHFSVWDGKRTNALKAILMVVLVAIGLYLAMTILGDKLDTSSGSTRADDFAAGYQAWQNNILFGNGLTAVEAAKVYMSGFRSNNLGFSNSPMDVLTRGGIVLMLVYAVGFALLLMKGDKTRRFVGLLFLYLWIITIVTFLPMTSLFLALGVESSMRGMEATSDNPSFGIDGSDKAIGSDQSSRWRMSQRFDLS